jgi:hypothetical protein
MVIAIIHVLPALLQSHQVIPTTGAQPQTSPSSDVGSKFIASNQDHAISSRSYPTQVSVRTIVVNSPLERLGLYRRKSLRRIHSAAWRKPSGSEEEIFFQDDKIFLAWRLIGYGLVWTRNRSYGKVFPSLSVFPVVETFNGKVDDLIQLGEHHDFQRFLSTGAVHPFSRDPEGKSLLHVSCFSKRSEHFSDMLSGLLHCITGQTYVDCFKISA